MGEDDTAEYLPASVYIMPSAITIMNEVRNRPPLPSKHSARRLNQRPSKQSLGKAPSRVSTSSSGSASYAGLKRDVLYRAINEFDLPGSMVSEYADLLTLLSYDLTPFMSQGQTWCLCRGKTDGRSPCQRLIPEVYLRASVGKILIAAEKPHLQGDDLVEELATALSYAICSEHHRTIHKVVRALESREAVERWRSRHSWAGRIATPTPEEPSFDITDDMLAAAVENAHLDGVYSEDDMLAAYGTIDRLKMERQHQEYLRRSRRGNRSESDASSISSAKKLQELRKRVRSFESGRMLYSA